ncbi:MAG: hypothetical protein ACI4QX_05660 [Lachnospiraceae bacterium]
MDDIQIGEDLIVLDEVAIEDEASAADDVTITDDAAEITDDINSAADIIEEVETGAQSIVEDENVTVVYSLYSIWESGYTLGIEIKNNDDKVLRDWAAILPIKGEITSCW